MEQLAPLGPVYQAGTLSGNPVATACGLATLREISKPGFYEDLGAQDAGRWSAACRPRPTRPGMPFCGDSEGGMFGFFLFHELPQNYAKVMTTDRRAFNTLVPRPAGPRCLHRPGALRSRLHERRAHRCRYRSRPVAAAGDVFQTADAETTIAARRKLKNTWARKRDFGFLPYVFIGAVDYALDSPDVSSILGMDHGRSIGSIRMCSTLMCSSCTRSA